MKLAAMHLNIHLVVLFHVNKERNSLFKLLFCKKEELGVVGYNTGRAYCLYIFCFIVLENSP